MVITFVDTDEHNAGPPPWDSGPTALFSPLAASFRHSKRFDNGNIFVAIQ